MQCKWAKSIGELEGTHEEAWGTVPYTNRKDPAVFFGLYDLRDYIALWRHTGKKYVLWAGSDILNFKNNFLFNDGKLKTLSQIRFLKAHEWIKSILNDAEHWVENYTEKKALNECGVRVAGVAPSFMGDIKKFDVSFKWQETMDIYLSASGDRVEEYGFPVVERIAKELPFVRFHLYGASWETKHTNVVVHGRVPKEQMNEEIKGMQCALRLNEFDGFSEILAKAILMGQYPISRIKYAWIPSYENDLELILLINQIRKVKEPNVARNHYLKIINEFPWAVKNN